MPACALLLRLSMSLCHVCFVLRPPSPAPLVLVLVHHPPSMDLSCSYLIMFFGSVGVCFLCTTCEGLAGAGCCAMMCSHAVKFTCMCCCRKVSLQLWTKFRPARCCRYQRGDGVIVQDGSYFQTDAWGVLRCCLGDVMLFGKSLWSVVTACDWLICGIRRVHTSRG